MSLVGRSRSANPLLAPMSYFLVAALALPVLRLVEPVSRTPVTLVGILHYNPRSIELVRATIMEEQPAVRAVCVELCDERWNATIKPRGYLYENEFQAASEAARAAAGLSVQLADQRLSRTVREWLISCVTQVLICSRPLAGCASSVI